MFLCFWGEESGPRGKSRLSTPSADYASRCGGRRKEKKKGGTQIVFPFSYKDEIESSNGVIRYGQGGK